MSNLKGQALHSLKWVAISKLAIQIFRWISTFIVIRLLVPEDYAVMAIADMVAGYLVAFSSLGLGAILVTKKALSETFKREMLFLAYLVNTVLFLLQFFCSDLIASAYDNEGIGYVLKASSICYLFNIFTLLPSSILTRDMQFKKLSLIELCAGILSTTSVITMAALGFGYWSLVAGYLTNEIVKSILIVRASKTFLKPSFPRRRAWKLMSYSFSVSISEVIFHSRDSIDVLLGGLFLSKQNLGMYNVGLQVSSMPLRKIAPPLRKVAFPALASIRNEKERLVGYLNKIQRISFFVTIPIFWGLASTVDLFLPTLLGDKWSSASSVIAILCLVMPFRFAEEMLHPILKSKQKGKEMMTCNFIGLAVFSSCIFAGLQYGLAGLAMAWIVSAPAIYFLSSIIVCKMMEIHLGKFLSQWQMPAFAGGIMLVTVATLKHLLEGVLHPFVIFGLSAILGGAVYVAGIMLFQRSLITEIKQLKGA